MLFYSLKEHQVTGIGYFHLNHPYLYCANFSEVSKFNIQPISIAYTKYNGLSMTRIERMLIAWYGDMNLLNHIYNMIRSGSFEVEVTFHNRIDISEKKSRKDIASECEDIVRDGFLQSLNRGV